MRSPVQLFERAFDVMQKRSWEKIYVLVDIHETIVEPTWTEDMSYTYYPLAKETLQIISKRNDVYLIQWSSANEYNQIQYHNIFQTDHIDFKEMNKNSDVLSTDYADFNTKPYMNVILDDKAGFEPSDWLELYNYFKQKEKS